MWRWISYRDCRNVSWQWLVTRVAWAVSGALNSGKQFHVLIESAMEIWIRLRVLSCYMKMTSPSVSWLPAIELFNWFVSIKILYWCEFTICGKMNGCFGCSAYTFEDNINFTALCWFFQIKPSWHRVETEQHVRVMLHHLVPDKGWTLMGTHWKVKILTTVNSVSPNGL